MWGVSGDRVVLGFIVGGMNCGRGIRAPTNPRWGLGLRDIYWGDRLMSGRGAHSAPARFKQGFPKYWPLDSCGDRDIFLIHQSYFVPVSKEFVLPDRKQPGSLRSKREKRREKREERKKKREKRREKKECFGFSLGFSLLF
jgi:hypothetical protein